MPARAPRRRHPRPTAPPRSRTDSKFPQAVRCVESTGNRRTTGRQARIRRDLRLCGSYGAGKNGRGQLRDLWTPVLDILGEGPFALKSPLTPVGPIPKTAPAEPRTVARHLRTSSSPKPTVIPSGPSRHGAPTTRNWLSNRLRPDAAVVRVPHEPPGTRKPPRRQLRDGFQNFTHASRSSQF